MSQINYNLETDNLEKAIDEKDRIKERFNQTMIKMISVTDIVLREQLRSNLDNKKTSAERQL